MINLKGVLNTKNVTPHMKENGIFLKVPKLYIKQTRAVRFKARVTST